jgi:hypothetical protein
LAARARDQASTKAKPGLAAGKRLAEGETALDKNRSFTDADPGTPQGRDDGDDLGRRPSSFAGHLALLHVAETALSRPRNTVRVQWGLVK